MKKFLLVFILLALFCQFAWAQSYTADWEQLRARPYPQWFKDAKLGIFIHWGIYSVPAYCSAENYSEWFLRGLQTGDSLRINFMKDAYGSDFNYNDFASLFKARLFDPQEWATLFKKAGAKYVVLVSKHHDGYALWQSKYARNWNSVDVGPKRDIVGELTDAVRESGLKMGLYYSLAEWNHPLHRWYTDPDRNIGTYVEEHMIPQFKELVSTYKPSLIFSDGEWNNTAAEWHAAELISWYFNLIGEEAIVNDRWGSGSNIGFLTPEYSAGINVTDRPWAEVRGLGRSFALNRNEKLEAYLSPQALIHFFVNAVANGGGIILNVGPDADGQIPLLQQERLIQLGTWIQQNEEAIYGATPWHRTTEEKAVTLQRIDPQINFDWVRNTPGEPIKEDHFTAIWTGFLEPDKTETYIFEATADDNLQLWIEGKQILDTKNNKSGTISLQANKRYPLKITYTETTQNAHAHLRWAIQNQTPEVIPSQYFFTEKQGNANGLQATYTSQKAYRVYTQNKGNLYAINLEFPENELKISLPEPNAQTKVTLLGHNKNLPWHYDGKELVIDTSVISYHEVPNPYAWVFKIEPNPFPFNE